eukprot:COSAG05_NODE_23400_length_258_cov_0.654088_1_plen_47_part_10
MSAHCPVACGICIETVVPRSSPSQAKQSSAGQECLDKFDATRKVVIF